MMFSRENDPRSNQLGPSNGSALSSVVLNTNSTFPPTGTSAASPPPSLTSSLGVSSRHLKRKPLIVSLCIVVLVIIATVVALYPDPDLRAPYHQPHGNAFTGQNSPVVFTGVVLQRLRPSGFWAGIAPAWQGIRYRVESVSVGTISQPEVIVAHVIVGGNALYRSDYPALSKRVFRVGARLRIHAQQLPDTRDLVCWEQESNVEQLK